MAVALRDVNSETGVIPFEEEVSSRGMQPVPDGEGPAPMEGEDLQGVLRLMLTDAIQFVDTELTPVRTKALEYYKGEPFGNEQEGRSSIVMTTVRDVILSAMPSFMRMFMGTERAVEFVPKRPDLVDQTRQQSEYITMLYRKAPSAILSTQACVKDGLMLRLGFVKWYWDPTPERETTEMTGLTDEAVQLLENEEGTTYTVRRSYPAPDYVAPPATPGAPPAPPAPRLHDCSVTRIVSHGRPAWESVPPEEILWSRAAREFDTAGMVVHRRNRRMSELMTMGFAWDDVIEQARSNYELEENLLNVERNDTTTTLQADSATSDKSMWKVMLYECYARADEDGDGVAELRQYYLIGTGHKLIPHPAAENGEYGVPVDEIPIAYWCPDPTGHTVEGQSLADLSKDLQRLDSELMRGMINSLALSINARTAVQEGQVSMKDLLSPEVGGIIRTRGRPADVMQEYRHSFVGSDVLSVLQYSKEIREERTGRAMEAQGLNADALQSSTKEGVQATLNAAQERIELMARFYAEGILVPLFRGLYRLTKRHQDYARTVRMQGTFVTVDPRTWDDDCEVEVKLVLGGGMTAQKLASIQAILAKQEQILGMLGVSNPLVTIAQYTRTIFDAVELMGFPDPSRYFTMIDDATAAQLAQAAQQSPKTQDPAATVAQAQAQALAQEVQLKAAQFALDREKFQADQQYKAQSLRQAYVLGMEELQMKYGAKASSADIQHQLEEQKVILEDLRLRSKQQDETVLKAHKIETDAAVARESAHTQAVADVTKAHVARAASPEGT